jgi:hypothetical protein
MAGLARRFALPLLLVAFAGSTSAQESAPAAPAAAPADAAQASSAEPEWGSTSRARVAAPVPQQAPMASDLVPLPPPPPGATATPTGSTVASSPAPPPAPGAAAGPQFLPPPPPPGVSESAAGPQGPYEPKVKMAADQTGVMVSMTQKLESDRIRQGWAERGGSIGAFEASGGMTLMYLYKPEIQMTMTGVGFNVGGRVSHLSLDAPDYERRDRTWSATKFGFGADVGAAGITITTPVQCYQYVGCVGGSQTASMSTMTLTGLFGYMKAFGSFDSPSSWSGWAVGFDWAPSYQATTLTTQDGTRTENSQFNWTGFALNIESGSMKSMALKMGKQAHMKMTLFVLPPISSDIPFIMNLTIGAVWY